MTIVRANVSWPLRNWPAVNAPLVSCYAVPLFPETDVIRYHVGQVQNSLTSLRLEELLNNDITLNTRKYGRLMGIAGSNPAGYMGVSLVSVSLRRADASSRGAIPSVVCLSVIVQPWQREGHGPPETVVPWEKICVY